MNKTGRIIMLVGVMVVGLIVRGVGLNESPSSLGFDEAALGYNTYSLMETGRDEYGNSWPLSLRSFNDFKPALYAYLSIPFVKLWGLTGTGVRMVSVVTGVLSLVVLYWLLKKYCGRKVAIWLLLWLSFEPWRLHFSRNAFETHLSSLLVTTGAYLLLEGKNKWLTVAAFVLAAYSYHSARLTVPLLLVFWGADPLSWFVKKNWKEVVEQTVNGLRKTGVLLLGFVVLLIPVFLANSSLVLTRFNQENIFKRYYPYTPKEIVTEANPWKMTWANPAYYFGGLVTGHILAYVSPYNLSLRIYNWVKMSPMFIPGMGMLGWMESILVVVGLVKVIGQLQKKAEYRFLIYWLVAGIAPAAATWTWYHPLRALNIYPVLEIMAALGMVTLWKRMSSLSVGLSMVFKVLLVVTLVVTTIYTINNELRYAPFENHGEYQPGGYKEGMKELVELSKNYDRVIIDSPHAQSFIFLLFYGQIDPGLVQSYANSRPRPGIEGNLDFNFDKFVFRKIDWPADKQLHRTLFWAPTTITEKEIEVVDGAKLVKTVSNVRYETARIISID